MATERLRRIGVGGSVEWELPILLNENILSILTYTISNGIDIQFIGSYTSKNMLYKYGKIKMDFEGLKLFVLSSVIPWQPGAKMLNIDKILTQIFDKKLDARILFEIDGLKERLSFQIDTYSNEVCKFFEKILYGEIRLKGKYCSDIFVYGGDDNSNEHPYLVIFHGKNDKFFLLSNSYNSGGCTLGFYCNNGNKLKFLKQLVCSECLYKINDLYIEVSAVRDENGAFNDEAILHAERAYLHDFHPLNYDSHRC